MTTVLDTAGGGPLPTPEEFARFRALVCWKFGLDLSAGKQHLLASRLGKVMRDLHLKSFETYYRHVVEDPTGEALAAMADALTTHHTAFFREPAHFDFFRKVILPPLRSREKIDIWSAACSTGEEPYTAAFCAFDEIGSEAFSKLRILGTDLSARVLEIARDAVYPSERFQGLPQDVLRRYVLCGEGERKGFYRVKKSFRQTVEFRQFNLMDSPPFGSFPLIFCRNVLIYFSRLTQAGLVHRLTGCLEPEGYLFIGHAESLGGIDHALEYVCPSVYRKRSSGR